MRNLVFIGLVLVGLSVPPAVQADDVDALIMASVLSGREYGVDPLLLTHIWWHESEGNLDAIGFHGEIGAFQIKPPSFRQLCADMGRVERFDDLYEPHRVTELVAWALSTGRYNHWWTTYPVEGINVPEELQEAVLKMMLELPEDGR